MISSSTAILVASFVVGAVLGNRAVLAGLSVLVAFLIATASLPWQLGLPNLTISHFYLLGFLLAAGLTLLRDQARTVHRDTSPGLLGSSGILVATLTCAALVPGIMGLARNHPVLSERLLLALQAMVPQLAVFAPEGLAGELQALYVFLAGPMLFLVIVTVLARSGKRAVLVRAYTVAVTLGIAAPVVQLVALDPWVRPDRGAHEGDSVTGLVGFLQDPHSYAAFLLLAVAFCLGLTVASFLEGERLWTAGYLFLALAAFTTLLFTNSRAGLAATLLAIFVALLLFAAVPAASVPQRSRRWRIGALVLALLLPMTATAVLTYSPLRAAVHGQLVRVGNPRMWEPLEIGIAPLTAARRARWSKVAAVVLARPGWGIGPYRFRQTSVPLPGRDEIPPATLADNPHNYLGQIASEYGLPTLLCYLFFNAWLIWMIVRSAAASRSVTERSFMTGIVGGLVGVHAFSLVSHPLLILEVQVVFWMLAALAVSVASESTAGDCPWAAGS